MKIGVFYPENNALHGTALLAFADGLRTIGQTPVVRLLEQYVPVDVAVIFGVGKKNVPVSYLRERVIVEQQKCNSRTIIIEKGFVKRDEYYMVGMNGLNNNAYYNNKNCTGSRWEQLDMPVTPLRDKDGAILICGQVPSDASVRHIDIMQWYGNLVYSIKKITKRPIIFRPHPLAINRTPHMLGTKLSTGSLEEEMDNARVVVTFNSNTAVDAILHGVPALSFDKGSMAWDVTGHGIHNAEHPYRPSAEIITQWAYNLAYTQWNLEEMAKGLPFLHLLNLDK